MKMNPKTPCRLLSLGLLAFAGSAAVPSCGGTTAGDEGDTDGVTHWLDACDEDSDCGGLECVCGICTRRCADASACATLDASATCTVPDGCTDVTEGVCTRPRGPDGGGTTCVPMDARSDGTECGQILGYTFAGRRCEPVECGCEGSECDDLFASFGDCRRAYAACLRAAGDPCAPMDAASNGDECMDIVGFAWNGERCEPVLCGCEGSDCGRLPPMGICEQDHLGCHIGLAPQCRRSTDCTLDFADCCGYCGITPVEALVAIRADAREGYRAYACEPGEACPDCYAEVAPDALALCVGFECRAVDMEAVTRCTSNDDCRIRFRDCCECDGLPTEANVVAVSDLAGYERLACAEGYSCATCDSEYPPDVRAVCRDGHCAVEGTGSPGP
jgi:hypothetical protein